MALTVSNVGCVLITSNGAENPSVCKSFKHYNFKAEDNACSVDHGSLNSKTLQ